MTPPSDEELIQLLSQQGHIYHAWGREPLPAAVRRFLVQVRRDWNLRIRVAGAFEGSVIEALRARRNDAERFGQGQLSSRFRDALKDYRTEGDERSPVSWLADIITAKTTHAGVTMLGFVDAKSGERWRETGNHDIEVAALETAEAWAEFAKAPVYFVFSDWGVADPVTIRADAKPGPFHGNGSGTPFLLFPTACCMTFDEVFGPADTA